MRAFLYLGGWLTRGAVQPYNPLPVLKRVERSIARQAHGLKVAGSLQ